MTAPMDPTARSVKPDPDPTTLTTEQMLREVSNLDALVSSRMTGLRELIESQLTRAERQRVEQKADTKVAVDAALLAAKEAVSAALLAAKEAVREQTIASERAIAKSEAATSEQLKQLASTFTTMAAGMTTNHDDLKERVGKIEAIKLGAAESRTEHSTSVGLIAGGIGAAVGLSGLVLAIVLALTRS